MRLLLNFQKNNILSSLILLLCLLPMSIFASKISAPAQVSIQSNPNGHLVEILISIKLTKPVEKVSVFVFSKGIDQPPELLTLSSAKQTDDQQYRFVFNKEMFPQIDQLAIGIDFINQNLKINESYLVPINPIEKPKYQPQIIKPKNGEAIEILQIKNEE